MEIYDDHHWQKSRNICQVLYVQPTTTTTKCLFTQSAQSFHPNPSVPNVNQQTIAMTFGAKQTWESKIQEPQHQWETQGDMTNMKRLCSCLWEATRKSPGRQFGQKCKSFRQGESFIFEWTIFNLKPEANQRRWKAKNIQQRMSFCLCLFNSLVHWIQCYQDTALSHSWISSQGVGNRVGAYTSPLVAPFPCFQTHWYSLPLLQDSYSQPAQLPDWFPDFLDLLLPLGWFVLFVPTGAHICKEQTQLMQTAKAVASIWYFGWTGKKDMKPSEAQDTSQYENENSNQCWPQWHQNKLPLWTVLSPVFLFGWHQILSYIWKRVFDKGKCPVTILKFCTWHPSSNPLWEENWPFGAQMGTSVWKFPSGLQRRMASPTNSNPASQTTVTWLPHLWGPDRGTFSPCSMMPRLGHRISEKSPMLNSSCSFKAAKQTEHQNMDDSDTSPLQTGRVSQDPESEHIASPPPVKHSWHM